MTEYFEYLSYSLNVLDNLTFNASMQPIHNGGTTQDHTADNHSNIKEEVT